MTTTKKASGQQGAENSANNVSAQQQLDDANAILEQQKTELAELRAENERNRELAEEAERQRAALPIAYNEEAVTNPVTAEQIGTTTLPKFDMDNLMPRDVLEFRGKLHVSDKIRRLAHSKGLALRWVNQDENGRYEEAQMYENYAPILKNGEPITAAGGSGMRVALMATPIQSIEMARKALDARIIDPMNPKSREQMAKEIQAGQSRAQEQAAKDEKPIPVDPGMSVDELTHTLTVPDSVPDASNRSSILA